MLTRRDVIVAGGAGAVALTLGGCARSDVGIKIGFIVKQPEAQWFQEEWRFAEQAAARAGFAVIRIGASDGDRVLTAIDTLYARHAQGFVICAPDPHLGTAIVERAAADGLKLMSVDDRLLGADGRPIAAVPHVGISALAIGALAGNHGIAEARRRGWPAGETGVLRLAFDSLETARERTMGGRYALIAAGLPANAIFDAPQRTTDTEGGFTAASPVIARHRPVRHWIILGMNDEAVAGGVRAAEGLGFAAADVIGVGIGGSDVATGEFDKRAPNGFWGSVLLSPRRHGYDTAMAMFRWIAHGVRPPAVTYTTGTMMTRANYRALLAAVA